MIDSDIKILTNQDNHNFLEHDKNIPIFDVLIQTMSSLFSKVI